MTVFQKKIDESQFTNVDNFLSLVVQLSTKVLSEEELEKIAASFYAMSSDKQTVGVDELFAFLLPFLGKDRGDTKTLLRGLVCDWAVVRFVFCVLFFLLLY